MNWPSPNDFVHLEALPQPSEWRRAGLVMFFNLECAACVSRGIPFMKRLHASYGQSLNLLAIHTSYGHRHWEREQVEGQLRHFAQNFAKLPFPVALDISGDIARHWRIEGTPHWLAFDAGGELLRSIYGSQENAQTRLEYLLAELSEQPSNPESTN